MERFETLICGEMEEEINFELKLKKKQKEMKTEQKVMPIYL